MWPCPILKGIRFTKWTRTNHCITKLTFLMLHGINFALYSILFQVGVNQVIS